MTDLEKAEAEFLLLEDGETAADYLEAALAAHNLGRVPFSKLAEVIVTVAAVLRSVEGGYV